MVVALKLKLFAAGWLTTAFVGYGQSQVFTNARFEAGDNPEYKETGYDDSGWRTINVTEVWDQQSVDASTHYGWYRFHFDGNAVKNINKPNTDADKYIVINLGPVDDADETYLNGTLIGKTGRFPQDEGGYLTEWRTPRRYVADSKLVKNNGDNVLAVRVYSGNVPGGIYGAPVTVATPDVLSGANISFSEIERNGKSECNITLSNESPWTVKGVMEIQEVDVESGKPGRTLKRNVSARSGHDATITVAHDQSVPVKYICTFTDGKTGDVLQRSIISKYILTPPAPLTPRINTAPVYGVRPGSPVHFRFGVSGERPMTFTAQNLPAGLKLDSATGVLSGSIKDSGDYDFTVKAVNTRGEAEQAFSLKVGDVIGLTPPMGWNSWNCWGLSVSQEKVMSSANALIDKGLADYGYSYVNIDDAWEAPQRNPDGTIAVNEKFPDIKALGDWLHERGLKFGIYSSPGDLTCGEYLGSLDHERQDAQSYNEWGVDYLKYDWCGYNTKFMTQKDRNTDAAYIRPYMLMGEFLREQPRDIFYSLCQYGMADVWEWGRFVDANSWRTTYDIEDTWESLFSIGFEQQMNLAPYAGPGGWNDPDMMIVGKVGWSDNLRDSRLTADEQYSHVSLWALLAANMLIGCDLAQLDDFTINLLCNNEVNAVNQDILGKQATCPVIDGDIRIWIRPLADGSKAIGVFNVGTEDHNVNLADYLPRLGVKSPKTLRDLWRQKDLSTTDLIYPLSTHAVRFLKVTE